MFPSKGESPVPWSRHHEMSIHMLTNHGREFSVAGCCSVLLQCWLLVGMHQNVLHSSSMFRMVRRECFGPNVASKTWREVPPAEQSKAREG
eukprot:5178588-Amphidinium_carterae.1